MRLLRGSAALAVTAGLIAVSGCSQKPLTSDQGGDPSTATATVVVKNMAFTPERVTVKAGQSVAWKFDDGDVRHDVTADDKSFASKAAISGHYTHKFTEAGTYKYDCSLHPSMRGVVVVKPRS